MCGGVGRGGFFFNCWRLKCGRRWVERFGDFPTDFPALSAVGVHIYNWRINHFTCFAESTAVISVLPQQRTNEANETKKTVNCFASDTFVSHATDVFVSNTDAFNKPNLDLIADHPPSILSLLHISPLYSL